MTIDEKLNEIMWKGQQIEALLNGIQSLSDSGSGDLDAMDTLAYIAKPMINEVRNLADEVSGMVHRGPTEIKGGAS